MKEHSFSHAVDARSRRRFSCRRQRRHRRRRRGRHEEGSHHRDEERFQLEPRAAPAKCRQCRRGTFLPRGRLAGGKGYLRTSRGTKWPLARRSEQLQRCVQL